MIQKLKKITKNQAGFTLIELMVALTITGIVTAAVTMITFQVFNGEALANNHMDAITRVQNAGSQISRDANMAQAYTSDGDSCTLTWSDWENNEQHEVIYSLENNELRRDYYIDEVRDNYYIFQYVSCEFPPEDSELSFTLTATVGVGSQQVTETRVYSITPRPSI